MNGSDDKMVQDRVDNRGLSRELFVRRARDILALVADLRAEMGLTEALNRVAERYVDHEPQDDLRRFGLALVLARRQALMQQRLDDDREALHHGHLNHEERVSRGHHYEMLRREACEYNHLLRAVVQLCGQYFSRDELMDWLVTASQGRSEWAKSEITGAVSEVALHAALQGMPELKDLHYASLDDDLRGYDFVASWHGKLLTIDAKTGYYAPLTERKHGHKHLEISVPRQVVDDFRLTRRGLDLLRHEVRQALSRG